MSRTKKAPEELLKSLEPKDSEEKTLILEDTDEPLSPEESDGEADPEKTVEIELAPKARAPRKRAPKKEKEVIEPAIEPEIEVKTEGVLATSQDLQKSMESMVKQWHSVKEMSTTIATDLEKVNTFLKMPVPAQREEKTKEAAPRMTLINKVALGTSVVALLLSVLSFSIASSTRNHVFSAEIAQNTKVAAPKIAVVEPPQNVISVSHEKRVAPVKKSVKYGPYKTR